MQLFLAFIVALSITAALIPFLARWAGVVGLTDRPGPRKVHAVPVPRVGGIAMAAGILVPALIVLELTPAIRGLLTGVVVLLAIGIWDDRADLGYRTKFVGQIVAVLLCMHIGGLRIDEVTTGGAVQLPDFVSWPLTFVFLVGVTNAVNLSDGLDGLAGGMALLCFCALALLGAAGGSPGITAIALIEAGAILGFLRFNTHPARVFMGDSGSQVLGFTIGALSILATQGDTSAVSAALPLLLIGIPLLDTAAVMLQRIREGRSPFSSDRNHLHHKLLNLGFAHAEAVILIYVAQLLLFLLAYFLRFESDLLIATVFLLFATVLFGLLRWASVNGWQAHQKQAPRSTLSAMSSTLALLPSSRMPDWSLWVMGLSLAAYATTVIAFSDRIEGDLGLLCLALLLLIIPLSGRHTPRSLTWLERVAAYVSAMLIVYLDQTAGSRDVLLSGLSWVLLAMTGAAALVRFLLSSTRRFEVTSLDVLVMFIALVLPNLPGFVQLPEELPAGIAKGFILLYVVEMLLATEMKRQIPRALLAVMLGAIAARALITASA